MSVAEYIGYRAVSSDFGVVEESMPAEGDVLDPVPVAELGELVLIVPVGFVRGLLVHDLACDVFVLG